MPLPSSLGLRDPELITRWEALVAYGHDVPARPQFVAYTNALITDWSLVAERAKGDQGIAVFTKLDEGDERALDELKQGQEANTVYTEYRVGLRRRFIVRHIRPLVLRGGETGEMELAPGQHLTLRDKFRLMRTALTTEHLTPSPAELDELLAYLKDADAETVDPRKL